MDKGGKRIFFLLAYSFGIACLPFLAPYLFSNRIWFLLPDFLGYPLFIAICLSLSLLLALPWILLDMEEKRFPWKGILLGLFLTMEWGYGVLYPVEGWVAWFTTLGSEEIAWAAQPAAMVLLSLGAILLGTIGFFRWKKELRARGLSAWGWVSWGSLSLSSLFASLAFLVNLIYPNTGPAYWLTRTFFTSSMDPEFQIIIFLRQELWIYSSVLLSGILLYQLLFSRREEPITEKPHSPKTFWILWILFGCLGAERWITGKERWIAHSQTTGTFLLAGWCLVPHPDPDAFSRNPVFFLLLVLVLLSKTVLWFHSARLELRLSASVHP